MALGYKLSNDARQNFEVIIDGTRFSFNVYWNATANKWFMDVSDSSTGNPIISGEAIVASVDYSDRLGLIVSHFWLDVIDEFQTPVDPERDGFSLMQFYTQPKDFVSSGESERVPLAVVTHNGIYVIHDGSYVIYTVGV